METPLYLKVLLWGHEIGRLTWRDKQRDSYFVFNPEYIKDGGRPSDLSYSLKDSRTPFPTTGVHCFSSNGQRTMICPAHN